LFIDDLNEDLKAHKTLIEIASRTKKPHESYGEFIKKTNRI
jgi:hypothetical protein